MTGHPYEPMLAVSGIDHTIKIFSPDAYARDKARRGTGISPTDSSGFSSIGLRRTHEARRQQQTEESHKPKKRRESAGDQLSDTEGDQSQVSGDSDDEDEEIGENGLASRKSMHLEYQITSQNDLDRKGGKRDAYITVS